MSSIIPKNFQNIFVANIIPVPSTSASYISATNITATNLVINTSTISNIVLTGNFNANGTSNTLANIFTTGGNVGINTTAPAFTLDITGSTRINSAGNLFIGNPSINNNLIYDNIGVFIDSNNNSLGYRLGLIKKNGSGPAFATSNNNNFIFQVANTTDASLVSTNTYSTIMTLSTLGNLTITGTANSVSLSSGNIFSTNTSIGSLNVGNINFTGSLSQNGAAYPASQWTGTIGSALSYTSGNTIISTLNVTNSITTVSLLATTSISSGSVYSTNLTSSNIFASNTLSAANASLTSATISTLAAANIVNTNITTNSILSTTQISSAGLFSSNITTVNLVSSFTSIGNLTSLTGTFANKVGGSQTVGTLFVTTSASLIGNTNTIGNIYTTGGNVGINTTSPVFTLDVNGSLRISSLLVNASSIISVGGTTTLSTTANTNQFVIGTSGHTVLLPNSLSLAVGAEYYIANQSTQPITIGNNLTTALNILNSGCSQFFTLTSNTGAGGLWTSLGGNFLNGSTGNIGLNTTNPGTSLDIIGSSRLLGMNYIGNPNNTADNLGTFIDGNNNGLGYRLGIVKKNGFPPFFATNNNNSFIFSAANNTDASQITTNSYTTVMNLSTTGTLTLPIGGLNVSFNSNTIGNLFTTGGNVGINNVSPAFPLHITASTSYIVSGGNYFGAATNSVSPLGTGLVPVSIFATQSILTQTNFLASSDNRIKNICNENINLSFIDEINPVIYTYKDKIKNSKKNIGFIAQNIIKYCPEAVTLHKEVVPDIMEIVNIIESIDNIITIKNKWNFVENDVIKIMVDENDINGQLVNIIYSNANIIKFKNIELKKQEKVFVYGRQIDDFHELNYDYVFALGFAGIKESRKDIVQLKDKIAKLENIASINSVKQVQIDNQQVQINDQQIKINDQQAQINNQQTQINTFLKFIESK